jgi:hypothetical protein
MARTKDGSRSRQRTKTRLWGAPDPTDFKKSNIGRTLEKAAKIHFKNRRDIDRLIALEKLAIDIFSNSASARAFATNPQEYMAQAGLPDVKLDLNSPEVRLAMAMGDPKVRQSAAQGDTVGFVRAVMDQGLKDLSLLRIGGLFVIEIVAAASVVTQQLAVTRALTITKAVAITEMAVVTEIEAVASGGTPIALGGATAITRQVDMLSRMAEDLGSPALAKSVRSAKVRRVLKEYIDLQPKTRKQQ